MKTEVKSDKLEPKAGSFPMSRYGWMNRKNRSSKEWTEEEGWRPRPGYKEGLMWRNNQWKVRLK